MVGADRAGRRGGRRGQVIGTVSSIDGTQTLETITAPADGVLIFITSSPAVAAGGLLLGLGAR